MRIYFSHPSITHHKTTEKKCIKLIKKKFGENIEVINPADFSLSESSKENVKKADVVVGLALKSKLAFLVWNELEFGEKNNLKIYTLNAANKNQISNFYKGIPEDFEKLDRKASKSFIRGLQKDSMSISSFLFGKSSRF